MKLTAIAALGLCFAAMTGTAVAEDNAAAPVPLAAAFTIDTPVEALMADERARAVVSTYLPGIDQHPAYEDFKAISLKTLLPFSQGLITDDLLAKIAEDLAAIQ